MGASTSARRDGKSPGDASTAQEQDVLSNESQGGENVGSKLLQKNGKISDLNGKTDDQIEGFDGRSGEKVLAEVGQADSVLVSQKDDILEVMEVLQDEVTTLTAEKELPKMYSPSLTDEKATNEEPNDAREVGFKKIFRFVGFKFTLKKDKPEKPAPVQPTVNEEEAEEAIGPEITEKIPEVLDGREGASESPTEVVVCKGVDKETTEQSVEQTENIEEITPEAEPPISPVVQEIQSPIKRFFTQGIFSSLRKRSSFKKPAEEAPLKEKVVEKESNTEKAESPKEESKTSTEDEVPSRPEHEHQSTAPEEPKVGSLTEITLAAEEKQNEGKIEVKAHTVQTASEEDTSTLPADTGNDIKATEQESGDTVSEWTCPDKVKPVLTTEANLLSCQEKVKNHGSPLKKLFTGTNLKKRSKKLKGKREAETKLSTSGEPAAEQLQSSTDSAESPRIDSSFSSPEESTEYVNGDPLQAEAEADKVSSDEERKRDGIQPWASFKKLMTPKKQAKMSSESEDEAAEKPKTATLSSVNNSVFTEQQEEQKPSEEKKVELSTEEPPRKKESSMSWEALLCRGSAKKRARKTSDSDGEKVEEDEDPGRTVGSPIGSSQDGEHELLMSSPEQAGSPSEGDGESTWASLKRLVTPRRRARSEDRAEDSAGFSAEQVPSDSEMLKEEMSFSLKRLIPGRRKKGLDGKQEQVLSDEGGKDFGSAEEDSDTPAVIPLSEFYLTEFEEVGFIPKGEAAEKQMDTIDPEVTKQELPIPEPTVTVPHETLPTEVKETQDTLIDGMEEQSASWILTTAEVETEDKTESITTHQQLSDIPEEGAIEDTAVTPKSMAEEVCQDDTIAEDVIELTSEAVTAPEEASEESFAEESTEMVSAVSRLTDSPGTSGETTPVAAQYEVKETKAVLRDAVENINLSVDIITATKEVEKVLVTHAISETTAFCIGLDSQEIQPVEEARVKIYVVGVPEVSEVLSAEIVSKAKRDKIEVVGITQEEVYEAQVEVVKTEFKEEVAEAIPQVMEVEVEQINSVKNVSTYNALDKISEVMQMEEVESVNELQELRPVQKYVVNLENVSVDDLNEQVVIEDKPKFEPEEEEEPLCSPSAQVIKAPIMKGEKEEELDRADKSEGNVKYYPMPGVIHCLREEFSACMSEPPTAENAGDQETPINAEAAAIHLAVAEAAISIINPSTASTESEIQDITNEVTIERVSSIKFMDSHEIDVLLEDTEFHSAESIIEAEIEAALTDTIFGEDIYERVEEKQEVMIAEQVTKLATTEEQSSITVQETLENVLESLIEPATELEAAESHEEEGKCTSILENLIPASKLIEEPQIAKEPEAVSLIVNKAEKIPEDIKCLTMLSDASIEVEVQSPTGQEAEDVPTQSEVVEAELSDVHVLEETEIAAVTETYVRPILEENPIDESIPMEAIESLEKTAGHHEEEQRSKNQGVDTETPDMEVKFLEEQMEEDGKETMGAVSLEEGRREMGKNVENHLQSKTQTEAVEHDQNQVDSEGCSQRETHIIIELQQDNPLCPQYTQDMDVFLSYEEEYVMVKQEDVKEVSLNALAPHVPSQMKDVEDFLSQTRVAGETSHPGEMNKEYAQQDSPYELQSVNSEMSKYLTETTDATTEQCSQKDKYVQSQVVKTVIQMQMPLTGTRKQEVEITEDQSRIVEETQFENAADSMTQDAAESNEEGGEIFTSCLISQELEGDITQKPMKDSEQTTATTNLEAVSEIAKPEDAQSQEGSSEEVIRKASEDGTIQEVLMKNETTKKSQTQASGDGQAGAFPAEIST
ncbi:A-kinase anchor protein 12-like isoform X2 [Anguilla rostrata]|uniref:A-kinase anchor protein 12-like isoform X2 n=1 Tax=Anguilla rostrata TaxID=7938 RepID=UPI0030CDF773